MEINEQCIGVSFTKEILLKKWEAMISFFSGGEAIYFIIWFKAIYKNFFPFRAYCFDFFDSLLLFSVGVFTYSSEKNHRQTSISGRIG